MANRFATGQDYSQTFMYLYDQGASNARAAADRVDAKRESELAAKDSLVFAKWQEGKLSGQQLMAHIRARQAATGYDRAQKLKWQEAAITYGNVIADEEAEARYANSENINALIQHYAGRLAAVKAGTPERRELAQRLRTLRDQRDADSLRKQGRRIARAIQRGDMNTRDLIKFYQEKLPTLRGEMRESVRDTLVELRAKLRNENFEVAMQKIDTRLSAGRISPADAAKEKMDVLRNFELESRDKVSYHKWLEQVRQLRATPDPAAVTKLDFDLAAGNITPTQYSSQIEKWADQIAPYDQQAAWRMRSEAQTFLEQEYTPLDDPGALGKGGSDNLKGFSGVVDVIKNFRGNAIKFISQFDGSKYSGTNCGMASGAMLAHMMGYSGLTGADLRALSGDTAGGTNAWDVTGALGRADGQLGKSVDVRSNWSYEDFKKRVAAGSPAVLNGWTGNLPPQLNSTSGDMGHSVAIAGYDAKRDAFMVLDPSGQKVWWPAQVVRSFAFSGTGGFSGTAILGPVGTVDPKTLDRVGGKIKHISVNAAPMRPGSPPMTQYDPGPAHATEKLVSAVLKQNRETLRAGGIDEETRKSLGSKQDVTALLANRDAEIAEMQGLIDQVMQQVEAQGGEFDGSVQMVTTGEVLTREDIAEYQKQLIAMYDAQALLYTAIGEKASAKDQRSLKEITLITAATLNSLETEWVTNQQVSEAQKIISGLAGAKTPEEFLSDVSDLRNALDVIGTLNDTADQGTATERVDTATMPQTDAVIGEWDQLIEALDGEYADPVELVDALDQLIPGMAFAQDEDGAAFLDQVKTVATDVAAIEAGEATFVLLPDESGRHHLTVLPTKQSQEYDSETGEWNDVVIPDLSVLGPEWVAEISAMGYDGSSLPQSQMGAGDGVERVSVIPARRAYEGVKFLQWGDEKALGPVSQILADMGLTPGEIGENQLVSDDQLSLIAAHPDRIALLRSQGAVQDVPFPVQTIEYNGRTWYMDELSTPDGVQRTWHENNLPYVGRADSGDIPMFYGDYFGAKPTANGSVWIEYTPDEIDPTDTGSYLINMGVTPQQARDDITLLGGAPQTTYARNPEQPDAVEPLTATDPRHPMGVQRRTLQDFLQERATDMKRLADTVISQMPDAQQAAEVAFWDRQELIDRADAMGINQDGTWKVGLGGATPATQPSVAILKELGITVSTERDASQAGSVGFDHLAAARSGAAGVAAANAAERARKAAEKAAAAEAAKSTAALTSLPKITAGTSMAPVIPGSHSGSPSTPRPTFQDAKPKTEAPSPVKLPNIPKPTTETLYGPRHL